MKHTPLLHAVLLLGVFSLASCMHDLPIIINRKSYLATGCSMMLRSPNLPDSPVPLAIH